MSGLSERLTARISARAMTTTIASKQLSLAGAQTTSERGLVDCAFSGRRFGRGAARKRPVLGQLMYVADDDHQKDADVS